MRHLTKYWRLVAYLAVVVIAVWSVNAIENRNTHTLWESQIAGCHRGNALRVVLNQRAGQINLIGTNLNTVVAALVADKTLPAETANQVLVKNKAERLTPFILTNCAQAYPEPSLHSIIP